MRLIGPKSNTHAVETIASICGGVPHRTTNTPCAVLELLACQRANGFTTFIVSGGSIGQ